MATAPPRISVALCTFNGAKFLLDQLQSISSQTLKPCELIVCDDHSTDETPEIVRRFAATAGFEVQLHVQPSNLGWRANREDCYRRCREPLIAVCDQDDVWKPEKLELLTQSLKENPKCQLAFCDCQVVDESLADLGYTSWGINSLNESRQRKILQGRSLEALLPNTPVADATMLFRAALLEIALPLPPEWAPDAWLAIVAAASGGCTIVPRPLQLYRQHATNQQGGARKSLWDRYRIAKESTCADYFRQQETWFVTLRDRLLEHNLADEYAMSLIERRLAFATARRVMRERPLVRLWLIIRELLRGNYHRMGTGMRTLALDLFV